MMCGHHRHHRDRPSVRPTSLRGDDKRASDAERETVVSDLRAHAGEGRLGVDDLDVRVAAALAATTRADLAKLVADLPAKKGTDPSHARREHVRSYVFTMLLLVAIWALTGAGYFWPIWPILGWGVFVLPDFVAARRRPHRAST